MRFLLCFLFGATVCLVPASGFTQNLVTPPVVHFSRESACCENRDTADGMQDESVHSNPSPILKDIVFSGQWFLAFDVEREGKPDYNEFKLKRGYVTVQKVFDRYFSARVTQDIAVDREGDGEGDIEIRLKYMYLRYTRSRLGFVTKPFIETGLVHRPWIDFEQKVNRFRVQGTMFLERNGILRSADYGVTVSGLFGGEMDDDYKAAVNRHYPGKYGSFSIGLYNGGGYEAVERNKNKLMEGRLSIRPFPGVLPGFQWSFLGAYGKGNAVSSPDYSCYGTYLSMEHSRFVLTGMLYRGTGNLEGTLLDETGRSVRQKGYSFFGEVKAPVVPLALFARYDFFDDSLSPGDWIRRRWILGIAFDFLKQSKIVVDYDFLRTNGEAVKESSVFEIAVEVVY